VLLEIKRRGTTIFFSSHELHEVEALCDRIIVINQGRIIDQKRVPELVGELGGASLESYFMRLIRPEVENHALEKL